MSEGPGRPYDPERDATAQEPLTANEKKLVTRLFGDPFAFPMEYKAWLRGWLEEQFPRINTLSVSAASGAAGAFVPPAGAILDYGGDSAPQGYVLCDGAEYDKTALAYQRLFSAIGFKFGTGSTANMFKVPDLQGRGSVGKGPHADVDTLGKNEGLSVFLRRPTHRTSDIGFDNQGVTVGADANVTLGSAFTFEAATHHHGPVDASIDTAPYLVVNKIISLGS